MEVHGWLHTKSALQELENCFQCGVCNQLVNKPCSLGGCEHIFCFSCTDNIKGDMCPLCGVPSHVKDVQPDRQLHTAATLCRQLEALITSADQHEEEEDVVVSGKCRDKGDQDQRLDTVSEMSEDLMLERDRLHAEELQKEFAMADRFIPTSPPISRRTRRTTKVEKKKAFLANTNKTWCIGETEIPKCFSCKKSRRRVLFHDGRNGSSVSNFCDNCQPDEGGTGSRVGEKGPVMNIEQMLSVPDDDKSGEIGMVSNRVGDDVKADRKKGTDTEEVALISRKKGARKSDENVAVSATASKEASKPDTKNSRVRRTNKKKKKTKTVMTKVTDNQTSPTDQSAANDVSILSVQSTPVAKYNVSQPGIQMQHFTPQSLTRGQHCTPQSLTRGQQPWVSPSLSTPVSRRLGARGSSRSPAGTGSPASLKKNPKGETPLQVACIKGDFAKVSHLLADGADPNSRDHAGWTPLHEACNHGNEEIAAVLLDAGAVINMPGGSEKDTPLHDAVINHHINCVRLLLSRNANKTQTNLLGKTPMDLVTTDAMRKAMAALPDKEYSRKTQTELPPALALQPVVVTATGLNREQKSRVQKCAQMLYGKMVNSYTAAVTHVVTSVNAEGMCPRTLKYLNALLAGKWIVNIDWVDTCLEYSSRVPEEPFEVPGASSSPNSQAPNRARHNVDNQLPGLFTGCSFYFLGEFEYPAPTRKDLTGLIKAGNGNILSREPRLDSLSQSAPTVPYHMNTNSQLKNCSHFIIQDKVKSGELMDSVLARVPPTWIMDCIAQFKITDLPIDS